MSSPILRFVAAAVIALLTQAGRAADSTTAPATLETRYFRLTLSGITGHCEILDKETQAIWRPPPEQLRFGEVSFGFRGETRTANLVGSDVKTTATELSASFHPVPATRSISLRMKARALPDQRTLEFSYEADRELDVQSVTLLENLCQATDKTSGYLLVPVREGLLIPAHSGLEFSRNFDSYAYEGCHMAMLGAVQGGSAAMFTWSDPYVAAQVKSVLNTNEVFSEKQRLVASLVLRKSARSFRLLFLGKGDHLAIAKAYRPIAQEKGWSVTWDQKLRTHPERAQLFGAANIKLWSVLDRTMNEASTEQESVRTNWTFDEAALVAEHYKRDLKLDKVLFTMGGWIHRGYDNQHPDILPTAPECGGDVAFSNCVRRVMNLGYLCCLHDNYQDIYRDSPSWSERFIMKTADGKLARGGHWAGGMAFLTCSQMALGLAQRPQNLPAVKELSHANAYFIDTTYAAGLQECFDPAHALTRTDDLKWKQAISDYARGVFGVFGSECGREWAIPHSDFFEGLTGVDGRYFHDEKLVSTLGATVVPLFDLVYRDCIAMYGKYGYDLQKAAEYVLFHISIGRPLNYHAIPPHLYWQEPAAQEEKRRPEADAENVGDPALFTRSDNGWASGRPQIDRFLKNTYEILSPLNELTARMLMTQHEFLTSDRKVQHTVFSKGTNQVEVIVNFGTTNFVWNSRIGGQVLLPPYGFVAECPTFVAFHALSWNGLSYESAPLFVMQAMDKKPLAVSRQIRVYHGFGTEQVRIGTASRAVWQEALIGPAGPSAR